MSKKFTLPADLATVDVAELPTLLEQATAEAAELSALSDDDITDEQLAEIESLATGITALRGEIAGREQATEDRAQRIAAARAAVEEPAAAEEEAEEPGDEPEEPENPDAAADVVIPDDASELVDAEAAVLASGAKKPAAGGIVKRVAAKAPVAAKVPDRRTQLATITVGADVPDYPTGKKLADYKELASAFTNRLGGMPQSKGSQKVSNRYQVASIKKAIRPEFLLEQGSQFANMDKIYAAANAYEFEGEALTAAGGWCAPSETSYNLLSLATVTGILQLPEVGIQHGGLSFTTGPAFSDIYTAAGFLQTEAQAEAGTTKTFIDVECPDFTEARLDAIGFGVRAGILTNSAWPQLINLYLQETAKAHAHKVNAYKIGKIATAAGTAINAAELGSVISDTLSQLEMQAMRLRYKYRLAPNEVIEGFAPLWFIGQLRQDLAFREDLEVLKVTDAMINSWLLIRGIRLQWVYDYQDLGATGTAWPTTVDIILYPKGTFVVGTTDVIRLDAVYDTAGLAVNTYTAAFFEEGVMVFTPQQGNGVKVQITGIAYGRTGRKDITNLTTGYPA